MAGRYETQQPDLARMVADLQKRVANLESGNRAGATSIDKGELTISSGGSLVVKRPIDGAVVARIGDLPDIDLWGIAAYNPNPDFPVSNPQFSAGASAPDGLTPEGSFDVLDHQGDFVFTLGFPFGLGRPMSSYNFVATSTIATPSLTTTSGTFVGLWSAYGYTMHPSIFITYVIQNDVGTTSEVRLRDAFNSNPTTGAQSWGSGAFSFGTLFYTHQSPSTPGEPFAGMIFQTDLEARRVSGAGNVRLQIIAATGST